MKAISLILLLYFGVATALAQVDEARQAIERGEYVRAVDILSAALDDRATPDVYLNLGIAYGRMKEYQKAKDVLNEGSERYPGDARFHNELAKLLIEGNDVQAAKVELRRTLELNPSDNEASDQLATIDMSEGDVQSALRSWNRSGRPLINDILHNYYLNFGSWVVRHGVAFHPAGTLRYGEWKTTEARLFETDNFTNVGLEIEPTVVPDQYNAVVRTTSKTNTPADILFNLTKGAPAQISYFNLWNIANSGVNLNGNYRYAANRRRIDGGFNIPLPVAGLLQLEIGDRWRSENWNVSQNVLPQFLPEAQFLYKANAIRIGVKQIPYYRFELGAGFEYKNRAARGELPKLFLNSANTAKFSAAASLRLFEGAYQNILQVEAFGARRSLIGNTQFTGGTAGLNNRITLSKDSRTYFEWLIKGGTARGIGGLPVDEYFVLGIDSPNGNVLRGHTAARHGKYGFGPMGTDFVLFNSDVDRRLATIPFFNNLNIPFIVVKWEVFFDGGKTWDRNHIFATSKLLLDTGAGLRLETPTYSFNLVYGKSLRDGRNVLTAYYEHRLW